MSSEELGIRVSAFFTEFLLGCGIMIIELSVSSLLGAYPMERT